MLYWDKTSDIKRLQNHWSSGFSSVWVPEWPPFGKELPTRLHMFSLYFDYLYFFLFPVLVFRTGLGFNGPVPGHCILVISQIWDHKLKSSSLLHQLQAQTVYQAI